MKYNVLREHYGDRMFRKGDEREAKPSDVRHLVAAGVLAPAAEAAEVKQPAEDAGGKATQPAEDAGGKATQPVANKARQPVANKAAE